MSNSPKYSLCLEDFKKIGIGALLAGAGAIALFLLHTLEAIQIDSPLIASFVAWLVPVATNIVKKFLTNNK